ncbi:hypothetical protein BGX23_012003 [Mortierella sp. AD031]|nr:hypothetical protein BGX23_012003 [Mortierella sp. AD031]KAG0209866.1 hypothetical protein BGX33_005286 [Mortierella sp. NVP41]
MKFSKATTLVALCAVSCLFVLPSATDAQSSTTTEKTTATPKSTTTTTTTASSTTTINPTTNPIKPSNPPSSSTAPVVPTNPVVPSTKPTATKSAPPVAPVVPAPVPTGTGGVLGASCVNSSTCGAFFCAYTPTNTTGGTCQVLDQSAKVCTSNPLKACSTSADCDTAFSLCGAVSQNTPGTFCLGFGTPETTTWCPDAEKTKNENEGGSLTNTIKYAGIAVGGVAALGLAFALVRWQRRRQRSKVPDNMFGEIDYGMTDRSAPKSAEQNYPFSSRPHAHGSEHAHGGSDHGGYDNNQYYDDGGYQKDQYYGNDQYNNNQYYGNQQDNYGYDHHSGHGGQGQGGFYDNADYNDYNQQGGGGHHSPIATPAAAVRSPRQNGYGAEPSELDYGGHGGNGGGNGGNGGYGGNHGGHHNQGGYY